MLLTPNTAQIFCTEQTHATVFRFAHSLLPFGSEEIANECIDNEVWILSEFQTMGRPYDAGGPATTS
jgi:hypothetical protein